MAHPQNIPAEVNSIFYSANFVRDLDIKLVGFGPGWCETTLLVQERFRQQHGLVHGGVIATLADHTAGGAAQSVCNHGSVITVEFKINYLRPAKGNAVRCRATVLKAGKNSVVAEASVFMEESGKKEDELIAKLTETLFVIQAVGDSR